jgi:hypothetical protein
MRVAVARTSKVHQRGSQLARSLASERCLFCFRARARAPFLEDPHRAGALLVGLHGKQALLLCCQRKADLRVFGPRKQVCILGLIRGINLNTNVEANLAGRVLAGARPVHGVRVHDNVWSIELCLNRLHRLVQRLRCGAALLRGLAWGGAGAAHCEVRLLGRLQVPLLEDDCTIR